MFDEYPEGKSSSVGDRLRLREVLGTQAIATLRFNEVPPALIPGFLGIDNDFDHNWYLEVAGIFATQLHALWS